MVWVGLRNSDDVGVRFDLLTEVFVDDAEVAAGHLNNVSGGSSGFGNAVLNTVPLALTSGPLTIPAGAVLTVTVSVRRTCSGGRHNSGTARLWDNGRPIDSGGSRDAGSRVDAIVDGAAAEYFLREGFALSSTPGTSKQSIAVGVDSKQACPDRAFKPFGTWTIGP